MPEKRHPIPKGFLLSTAKAGIKYPTKKPTRTDMALIYSEVDAVISGTFTTNKVKGAPVKLCMERIRAGKGRAIVINSGNSNVATGTEGLRDAYHMASLTARTLGIDERLTYVASTGVIGVRLPMKRIEEGIENLIKGLGDSTPFDVAHAIMTTDTFPKIIFKRVRLGGKTATIVGIAKGAGMIAPKMATMLCFIITDLAVEGTALDSALKEAVEGSFNRITIDGDMSTSDTALIMTNGVAGNPPIKKNSRDYRKFKEVVFDITYGLSRLIATDGEGATKFIEVAIEGAKTESDALRAAFSVANSSLVKTAIYGNDINWGRVIAALGRSGAELKEEKIDIYFGKTMIVKGGVSTGFESKGERELKKKSVLIRTVLNMGKGSAKVLTCDLTEDYIKINAEYRT